ALLRWTAAAVFVKAVRRATTRATEAEPMRQLIGLAGVLALTAAAGAEPPKQKLDASSALGALTGSQTTAALSGNLRALLVESFPDPLFEDASHWGLRKLSPRDQWRHDGR